jgi:hypothetical protein
VPAANQAAQQLAVGAVDIHEPQGRAGDLVLTGGVLLGVGDIEQAAELLDVEGRKPAWELAVAEAARQAAKESPTRLWTDGLQLGVLLVNLGSALETRFPLWIALLAVGALAVLRGWGRTALAATAIAALALARPLLPHVGLPWWLPGYGDWAAVGRYVWPAVVLAVLAWPGVGRLRPRSWWWLALPAAQVALPLAEGPWSVVKAGAEVGLLLAVLVVAVGTLDPRPAIAAAVYLVPGLLYAAERIAEGAPSTSALGYWMVLAVLMATLAAAAWRVRRQHLTQR